MNLRKRHKSASAEIHTSAMNDIMFFLLLFFLIASTITNPAVLNRRSSDTPLPTLYRLLWMI